MTDMVHRLNALQLADAMAAYRAQHRPRVRCKFPLTRSQVAVAALLSEGLDADGVAARLGMLRRTVDFHIYAAAKRIPGDLSAAAKIKAWYRGATIEVLMPPAPPPHP